MEPRRVAGLPPFCGPSIALVTYYDVLGVDPGASSAEIRQAYVRLARAHHPDYFGDADAVRRAEADRRMRELNEAWAVLGDAGRRRAYDVDLGRVPGASVGEADRGFVPFDDDEDEDDPRDAPDVPFDATPPSTGRRLMTMAPAAVFVVSVAVGTLGVVLGVARIVAFAVVLFVVSGLLFLVVPLLALADAGRHDR